MALAWSGLFAAFLCSLKRSQSMLLVSPMYCICILHPLDSHISSSFASSWSVFGKQAVGGRSALCIFYMQIAILACVGVSVPFCRQVWQELCKVHVFHKAIQNRGWKLNNE